MKYRIIANQFLLLTLVPINVRLVAKRGLNYMILERKLNVTDSTKERIRPTDQLSQ